MHTSKIANSQTSKEAANAQADTLKQPNTIGLANSYKSTNNRTNKHTGTTTHKQNQEAHKQTIRQATRRKDKRAKA